MNNDFDKMLDECIDRINRGESLDACLADYPGYVEQLKPSLQAMLQTRGAYSFEPSADAKRVARQRFRAALETMEGRRAERQPLLSWLFGRSKVWAPVVAVILLGLIGYFGLGPLLFPPSTPPQPGTVPVLASPEPDPEGNFVFLISDDVNAIGDFESVNVSISTIGLLLGDAEGWVEFEPEVKEVDLALVQGGLTEQIWRGDVPEGQYTKVVVHVADVRGILKETGQEIEIKLPSQKLNIAKKFQVTADTVTSFTYDLTVIATGSPQSGIDYILKPQVDQSGADHKPGEPGGKAKGRDQ